MADMTISPTLAGFLTGSLLFWLYFHRYETHFYAFHYLGAFLAACAGGAVSLINVLGYSQPAAVHLTTRVAAAFLLGAYGNTLFFRLFLHPLNKFPGPYLARVSDLWLSAQLGKSDGHLFLQRLHGRYGKYVRVGSNTLSVNDADAVEPTFAGKSRVGKAIWYDNDFPLTSMHTTRDRALHDLRRRLWAPAFSEKALREYEPALQRFNGQMLGKFGEHAAAKKPVNVTKWFNLFSFDAMGALSLSRDYGMVEKGEKPRELDMLNEGMQPLAFRFPSWFFIMLTKIPGAGAGYNKFVSFCVSELAWRVGQTRRKGDEKATARAADEGEKKDIMHWLLKAYADVPNPEQDRMLQADARLIIVAGSDTTAAALTFTFFHLAQNPAIVEKLRAELEPLCQSPSWTDSNIRTAPLLNACINEALRMHPPVPSGVNRLTPPEGLQVGETYIPGNTTFILHSYSMSRDPSIYVEPDRFLPERWTTAPEKVLHPGAFVPFSAGPFGCIGKNLALMEMRTLITRIVLQFDVRFAPGEDGRRIQEESRDHFTFEVGDLDLTFTERSK